jgi:hypothetical protein
VEHKWKLTAAAACCAAAAVALAACEPGGHPRQAGTAGTPGDLPTSGNCRYVSASEMQRITGLRTIRPTESKAGCSYLYDATIALPSELNGTPAVNLPPSIDVYVYTDPRDVDNMSQALRDPTLSRVSGLGGNAGWASTAGELRVVAPSVAVMIVITPPDPPQHFRTRDVEELAVTIFKTVRTRLPHVA